MAGLIGLARAGTLRADEKVLFLHTGGLPSLFVYQDIVLGKAPVG
jgi:D-cysteine desulfhydrase